MTEVEAWRGEFGDDYTERNRLSVPGSYEIVDRARFWPGILTCCAGRQGWPKSYLEIGAGDGKNLRALHQALYDNEHELHGVEPNALARGRLQGAGFGASDGTAAAPGRHAELVFTYGVLIHIPPKELLAAYEGIYNAAERFIVSIEYFAAEPTVQPYRGRFLWKRDFGAYWMDNFKVEPLGCGFAWERMTGLDNVTWWAFRKCV